MRMDLIIYGLNWSNSTSISGLSLTSGLWCASGYVVECLICNQEVASSNLGRGYLAPRSTQPSILRGR